MVIWPAFRMGLYRVNDHPYHAPQFINKKFDLNYLVQYIARKFNIGQELNDVEARRVDQGADQIVDVRLGFIMLTYGL